MVILYVDDEIDLLELGKIFLKDYGFEVETANSVREALDFLKKKKYEAIISDYQMPRINGIEFLKEVRRHCKIPFILFTGKGREEVVIEAIDAGVTSYMQKGGNPKVQFAELAHKIKSAVLRRQAEIAIKRSEAQLAAIIQSSPIPKFVIDKKHRVIYWNKALEVYSGIKEKDIIGTNQHWRAFYPNERPCMADLLLDGLIENIPQWYEGKYSKSKLIDDAYEATDFFPHIGKTGTWLFFTASVIKDDKGNVIGAIETLEDSTEAHLKTEQLKIACSQAKMSEEKYRTVFENTGTATAVVEEGGIISLINQEFVRFSGFSKEEVEGKKNWTEFVAKEDLDHMQNQHNLRRQNGGKALLHYDFKAVAKTGEIHDVHLSASTIEGTKKSIISLLDITERKRAENALRQANKKLTLLYSITRHDINNQLLALQGYLTLAEMGTEHISNNYFQKAIIAVKNIASMIKFTKEYESIGVTSPIWHDCYLLVSYAAKKIANDESKIVVKNDIPAEVEVLADPLIDKVFYNLIDNALRYGGKITTIRFFIEDRNGNKIIVCEDDGEGILVEEKEKIFTLGFGKNTGLGLALSREILSITGITIIENGEPSKGARFEIMLPKGAWQYKLK